MAGRLQQEIKQTKPFDSLETEAALNIIRTAAELNARHAEVLKPYDLTTPQYNVLRILRGTGGAGLACGEIGDRMLTRDPDVTRLLDRLVAAGLVDRGRDTADRRVVLTRITAKGRDLMKRLDLLFAEGPKTGLEHLGSKRLRTLINLLEAARVGTA